jgi:hypothetical protein
MADLQDAADNLGSSLEIAVSSQSLNNAQSAIMAVGEHSIS